LLASILGLQSWPDLESHNRKVLDSFKLMLGSVGSDLGDVVHVTVFLSQMRDFDANAAYVEEMVTTAAPGR
jgi:enamine deaminase RidA (YjgF/YER057c/UK114 family)